VRMSLVVQLNATSSIKCILPSGKSFLIEN
jgi:hypothetical protein